MIMKVYWTARRRRKFWGFGSFFLIKFKPIFLQSGIDLSYLKRYTELPAAGENYEDVGFLMEFKPTFWQSGIDPSYLKRLSV